MKEELTKEKVAEIIQDRYNAESQMPETEEQKKRAEQILTRANAMSIRTLRGQGYSDQQIKKMMGEKRYSTALEYMQREEQAQQD